MVGSADYYSPVLTNFLISAANTLVARTSSAPLLRTKLIFQSQSALINSSRLKHPYTSLPQVLDSIIDTTDPLSLWRGNALDIGTSILSTSLSRFFRLAFKPFLFDKWIDGFALFLLGEVISSTLTVSLTQAITRPLSYIHLRLAVDTQYLSPYLSQPYQFPTFMSVVKSTYASDGFAGFYRGAVPAVLQMVVYRTSYFVLQEMLVPALDALPWKSGFWSSYVLGTLIVTAAGVVAYPFDTVKVTMDLGSCSDGKYSSMTNAARQIAQNEGSYAALWNGVGVSIAHAMTGGVALWMFPIL